ncbi:MAG: DMT family transporter [Anaerolineae bacterium]|nr:DMT family transporter [Anaerolineae bacterium]MDW8171341.1 DMT family transporter [Anaerolineae bacterium]
MSSTAQPSERAQPSNLWLALAFGVLAISSSAIFIRLAQNDGVPSLAIAAVRLSLAALLLTPFVWSRYGAHLRRLTRADLVLASASGFFLALHFITWISSLEYTSVLISVVFVTTGPIWVALLEMILLRARLPRLVGVGLVIAIVGGTMIGLGGAENIQEGSNDLLGASLSLAGAIAIAMYFIIGRKLRAGLTLLPYIWLVYSCAAVFLVIGVLLTSTPLAGHPPSAYLWLIALAVFPQLVGHTSLNYAIAYLPATLVSMITQLEPIGSAILALILFREAPQLVQVVGSLTILTGVILASRGQAEMSSQTHQAQKGPS